MKPLQPVTVNGIITRFKGNGRKLGYPTANLTTDTDLEDGVYFGFAELLEWSHHPAVIFIGTPTTIGDTARRVEVYLLDIPDEDYYGQKLSVGIRQYYRASQTFDSVEALLKVMRADEAAARAWFAAN